MPGTWAALSALGAVVSAAAAVVAIRRSRGSDRRADEALTVARRAEAAIARLSNIERWRVTVRQGRLSFLNMTGELASNVVATVDHPGRFPDDGATNDGVKTSWNRRELGQVEAGGSRLVAIAVDGDDPGALVTLEWETDGQPQKWSRPIQDLLSEGSSGT